jgi:type III pantothenate kinase
VSLPRRCLQLDVGNSSAKWRLVVEGEVRARGLYRPEDSASRQELLGSAPALEAVWVSSVARDAVNEALSTLLTRRWGREVWFAHSESRAPGLRNSYAEPRRMGVDRWLAMLAARAQCEGRLMVVDAGSALTIDLVSSDGVHEGGYIIPGPLLMERALLLDTDRVRFSEAVEYALSPGTSTAQAVRHGIALAQAGAVTLALAAAGEDEVPRVLFTGGGGAWLAANTPAGGEYLPDLVLDGLQLAGEARAAGG